MMKGNSRPLTFVSSRHSENALSIMNPSSPLNKPATLDDKTSPTQLNLCTYTVSSNLIKEFFDDLCISYILIYIIYRQGKIKEDWNQWQKNLV